MRSAVAMLTPIIGLEWTRDGRCCLHFHALGPVPLRPVVRMCRHETWSQERRNLLNQNVMKVLKVHKHFLGGDTDVSLDAPEFENFGNRMDELERFAYEADPIDPAEIQASTAKMMEHVQELHEQARKKLEAAPVGPKKAMDALMLGL